MCAQCFVPRLKFKKKTPPFLLLQNFNRSLTKYFTRSIVAIKLQLKLLQNSFNNFLIRFELKRILFSIDSNFNLDYEQLFTNTASGFSRWRERGT